MGTAVGIVNRVATPVALVLTNFVPHAPPAFAPPDVTTDQDRAQSGCQLAVTEPMLPSKLASPDPTPNGFSGDTRCL